ncbi:helix-turn-helix transcriptional regulator [Raoultibacter phocaeensis]|uniref:helix-turn-helix transcriptional regulator n=1 Tax=Raoultibacter phocaeensis TaxID=2479841 RepID=UPI001119A2BA|nr:LuxR C-terminal-related transcriptional regulator [Raoultibacter phocaeensis]
MSESIASNEIVIVPSKINVPSLTANVIERSGLVAKLDKALSHPLTSIVSSAGFGKTTGTVTWTRSLEGVPVAWFLLEPEDRSLDRFWLYLTAALRIADKGICRAFDEMRLVNDAEAMKPVIDALAIQMAEYGRDFVCVLEDFHTVHDSSAINDSMSYFMRRVPPNAHVVITSRQTLRFPTSKMRVEGSLNEIVEADLCFSKTQTAEFFAKMGFDFSHDEIDAIYRVTRGWPTGNRLVSLLGKGQAKDRLGEAIAKAKGSIDDYLFEEVLHGLTDSLQQFMVLTSVVGSFCLPLAERICGCTQQEAMENLDFIVGNNLFIEKVEREDRENWYRYHRLLADMLHERLARCGRDRIEAACRAARDWFEENDYVDSVVELSARIGDYEKIRMVIIKNWQAAYMSDNHYSVVRWASFLPESELFRSPMVCAVLAMPYALNDMSEKADACIAHAMSRLHGEEDFLYALCMVENAYLASFRNEPEGMLLYTEKALASLPENEFYLRGMMRQVQAAAFCDSDPLAAKRAFLKTVELQSGYGNKTLTCSACCNLAMVCANLGYLDEARQYNERALGLYEPSERRFKPMLTYAFLTDMIRLYERGDFEGVLESYDLLEFASSDGIVPEKLAEAESLRAKTLYRLNDRTAKQVFFNAMKANEFGALIVFPTFTMAKDYCDAFRTKAVEHAAVCASKQYVRLFEYMVAYHLDRIAKYEDLCSFAEDIDEDERYLKVHALAVAAVFSEKVARFNRAESYFDQALERCVLYGFDELLRGNALYVQSIALRAVEAQQESASPLLRELAHGSYHPTRANLTDRETDVVKLIASGYTVARAAEAMFVTRDTAKKHLANVYAKLGVHSKMEAVALLKEQGII